MNRPYPQLKNRPSAWQSLFRPMLLVSLGIHGLLLAIPIPSDPIKSAAEPPKPDKPEEVKISELLAPTSSPSPKPSPKKSSTKKAAKSTSKKAASAPRKQVASRPSASKSQSSRTAKQTSRATAGSATDSDSTSEAGEDESETSNSTTEAPEGFGDLFGGKLEGEQDEKLIAPNLFEKPESFYTEESLKRDKPERKPGNEKMKWISLKTPDDVLAELKPQLQNQEIQVTTQGKYGGGTVYQVKKGKAVRYINLVPVKGSIGTHIIVWSRNPNSSTKSGQN